ncbi:hypothetical protein V8G54_006548 [Vigna mungo]|uniref:Uroporphyrinogen-III synthase n=1 Tax=Vigna mungo TaxID=3915 RepID=A0AAQ3NZ73_VIGMU
MPHVKIGVVGTGTASIFEETLQSSNRSLDIAFVPSRAYTHLMTANTTPFNLQQIFKSTSGHCFQSSKTDALTVAVLNLYQSLTKADDVLNTYLKILEDNEYFPLWLKVLSHSIAFTKLQFEASTSETETYYGFDNFQQQERFWLLSFLRLEINAPFSILLQQRLAMRLVPVQHVDHMVLKLAFDAPVLTVASPSAIRAWKNLLSDLEWNNSVACIGETTAAMSRSLGFTNVFYPTQPGLEGKMKYRLHRLVERKIKQPGN